MSSPPSPLCSDDSTHHYLESLGALEQLLWKPAPLAHPSWQAGTCSQALPRRLLWGHPWTGYVPQHTGWLRSASATQLLAAVDPEQGHEHTWAPGTSRLPRTRVCGSVSVCFWSHSHLFGSGSSFYRPASLPPHLLLWSPPHGPPYGAPWSSKSAWLSSVTTPLSLPRVCTSRTKAVGHTWAKYPPKGRQRPRIPPGLPQCIYRRE